MGGTSPAAAPAPASRCGLVAIVGRPNVGKSTLLNALVGQKISITSDKAQTTRHRITGVRTVGESQFVFVDTPGFQTRHGAALNRHLNRTVQGALADVDVVLFVVEAGRFGPADEKVLSLIAAGAGERPVILVANKLDEVHRRADLAPWLQQMQHHHAFAEFVPLSARRQADVERLLEIVRPYLPEGAWLHDEDALTDRSERFLASELIREKLFRLTGDELPYTSTVVIEVRRAAGGLRRIAAAIVVEREAHKAIVIGRGGERLRRIGTRPASSWKLLGAKVFRRTVGQGPLRLGRRRSPPAQLRLRVGAAQLSMATRPCALGDAAVVRPAPLRLERVEPDPGSLHARRGRITVAEGRQAPALADARRAAAVPAPARRPGPGSAGRPTRHRPRCDAAQRRLGRWPGDADRRRAVRRLPLQ